MFRARNRASHVAVYRAAGLPTMIPLHGPRRSTSHAHGSTSTRARRRGRTAAVPEMVGAGARPRRVPLAIVLGALVALGPLTIDMYLPSLPTIQRDLATTPALTQLTLAVYFAGLGLGQLVYGPLTDRYGRKPPLYAGLVVYVLASVACALAPDVRVLVGARFVQALGGAAGQVVTRAVVRDRHVGSEAARLLAMLTLVMGVAPIVAPLAGGWVLALASWRAIFAVLAAVGLAVLALMIVTLPETATSRAPRIDLAMLAGSLRGVIRDRSFVANTLAGAFAQAGMFAYISGSPFVFIELFHVSPQRYGWLFGVNAFGLIAASQVNHRLLARRTPARILAVSVKALGVAGLALLAVTLTEWGGLAPLAVLLFVYVTSIGFIGSNAIALAMESQGARAGVASAVLGAAQFAVAAAASSLVGLRSDGSARAMGAVMAACAAAGWLVTSIEQRRSRVSPHGLDA